MSSVASSTVSLTLYPEDAWFTLAVFFVLVGLVQWGSVVHSKVVRLRKLPRGFDVESSSRRRVAGGGRSLTRVPLAIVNVFRVIAFRWSIRLGTYDFKTIDVLLTLAYVAFLLTWTLIGSNNLGVSVSDVTHWSSRAGLIAASQLPLVTILGTKHNVISLITGVGYEKLNFLHRVTARCCFGLLLIHAGAKIYSAESFLNAMIQQSWLRLGVTALSSLLILIVISLRPIRTRVYEVFFYMHFIVVFIFLVGAYFHTNETNTSYWIWPCFMFWALDRVLRLTRIVAFNHLYCGFSRRAGLQDATTELLSDDFVRVRVRRPPHFQWSPGQSAYIFMPSVSKFPLEAHPFSISSVDSDLFRPGAGSSALTNDATQWKELVFIINVRAGFTKRLKKAAEQRRTVKLFIDGPYGHPPDVGAYDTSILIAGGSGVTHTLPVFLDLIESVRNGTSLCRRVVFIWSIRDASHVQWISEALHRANEHTPVWLTVSIRIFVTRGGGGSGEGPPTFPAFAESHSVELEGETKKEGGLVITRSVEPDWTAVPPSVRIETGRPDFKSILRGEVNTASGNLSVTVCGSQSLTQSVREALRFPVSSLSSVLGGGPSVTLHVESFGYA